MRSDVLRAVDFATYRLTGRVIRELHNVHLGLARCDVVHLFNGVSFGSTPWVSTFETSLPRLSKSDGRLFRSAVRRLADPSCLSLIAMSSCARDRQLRLLDRIGARATPQLEVLHPPQPLLAGRRPGDVDDLPLRLLMVGGDFYRKGGAEVLDAFDRLVDEGADLRLTIVSSVTDRPLELVGRTVDERLERVAQLVERHRERIVWHRQGLQNWEVLTLLETTHLALLPTLAETYGYFVLEAQAAGVPVVTTSIRALPEINPADCGLMIDVPVDEGRNAIMDTDAARSELSALVTSGVVGALRRYLEAPGLLDRHGDNARDRIRREHDPATYASALERIYAGAA